MSVEAADAKRNSCTYRLVKRRNSPQIYRAVGPCRSVTHKVEERIEKNTNCTARNRETRGLSGASERRSMTDCIHHRCLSCFRSSGIIPCEGIILGWTFCIGIIQSYNWPSSYESHWSLLLPSKLPTVTLLRRTIEIPTISSNFMWHTIPNPLYSHQLFLSW